jgi:hypothetical protein
MFYYRKTIPVLNDVGFGVAVGLLFWPGIEIGVLLYLSGSAASASPA